jgi:hypothetical protein
MHTGHPFGRCHVLLTGCLLLTPALDAAPGQSINMRDGNTPLERCDQLDISFDNRPGLRDEDAIQLPVGAEPLTVSLAHQGGIGLREGSANQHEITLCKAVPDDRGADLAAIRAVVKGSSVEVAGPAGKRWAGYVIVRSPRGSHLSLSATNGPVRADSFEGDLNVRTTNGPIALMHVRGKVTARAENGPVRIEGDGGNVSVETQNGPIGVRLMGTQWQTGDLVARAQNGPLSLELPDQYRSGVEIESSGHAPWSCDVDCGTRDNDAGTRRARLGDGPTHVKLSTVNGPVKVR